MLWLLVIAAERFVDRAPRPLDGVGTTLDLASEAEDTRSKPMIVLDTVKSGK